MATIQIREIPDEAYEVIRRRARAAGQSIQAYMRELVISTAARPTPDEVLAAMDAVTDRSGEPGLTRESIIEALDEIRR